ncbi:helix-turn-helix domain-containing protein [Dyadobacter sp. CY347]|uniref:helix-turn-helix domain-containing protein n=1 Tax=Dyadobacter sp. CY347 TaxID=2909336 RepID=UPI001F1F6453|nr:helix-turn-helix domain-containing protein [Dyadobacter sp. CY347]MCF2490723.1 AraC family transcriptional regulator [Dyadobacter sp. CY347]
MKPIIRESTLKKYIKNIWVLENHDIEKTDHSLKFFADGCSGLMFQQTESGVYIGDKALSSFLLYGQTVKPIEMKCSGSYKMIVFVLYPYAIHALFGINACELTDTCLDMLSYSSDSNGVEENLRKAVTTEEQVSLMEAFLLKQASAANADQQIQNMTMFMMNSNGTYSIKDLQQKTEMSERTFERKFATQVGVPPKLFSKIVRFHSSIRQMDKGKYEKLSDVAYENGYADQSHFVRNFKEFTSITPRAYKSKKSKEKKPVDGSVQF